MQDLPGEELFQYPDADGKLHGIDSADVNAYLREAAGETFTSKDFRTWAGTVLAVQALRRTPEPSSQGEGRRLVVAAIDEVARQLGNTRAVCRKCYIHPEVLQSFLDGGFAAALRRARSPEAGVVALLTQAARARRDRLPPNRYSKARTRGTGLAGRLRQSLSQLSKESRL
jgi:DNA topoisomerase IB